MSTLLSLSAQPLPPAVLLQILLQVLLPVRLEVWLSLYAGTHGHVQCFWDQLSPVSLTGPWTACCYLRASTDLQSLDRWCSPVISCSTMPVTFCSPSLSGRLAEPDVTQPSCWRRLVIPSATTMSVRPRSSECRCSSRSSKLVVVIVVCLQCFDTVGWVAGRASGL